MNMDLVSTTQRLPRPGETVQGDPLRFLPGGKGANQAVAAALLGADVALIAAVGEDDFGETLRAAARGAGVDVRHVHTLSEAATGTAVITVDDSAENTIVISSGANADLTPRHLARALEGEAEVGVVSTCLEVVESTSRAALVWARARGAVGMLNLSPYRESACSMIALADLLLVNELESAAILGSEPGDASWDSVADGFRLLGATDVVVTRGAAGAVIMQLGAPTPVVTEVPAHRIQAVDTTGCGDAFAGAIAVAIAEGHSLVEAARFGMRVAAFAAQGIGAQSSYGRREQVFAL